MKDILREIGMIARALDSISNIEFKEYDLTKRKTIFSKKNEGNMETILINKLSRKEQPKDNTQEIKSQIKHLSHVMVYF